MAGANGSLLKTHLPNSTLSHLFAALDPISLILSQFPSQPEKPNLFTLTTDNFTMERGPRYNAYAKLRESKLRMRLKTQFIEPEIELSTPPLKKQGRSNGFKGSSVLAQSVPDFATLVRKENRKPPVALPPVRESPVKTPMGLKGPRLSGYVAKSVNSGEKRSLRKSYATMDELKAFSGSGGVRGGGKTVLGYKKY